MADKILTPKASAEAPPKAPRWDYNALLVVPAEPQNLVKACQEADAQGWELMGGPAVILVNNGARMERGILMDQQVPAFVLLVRRPWQAPQPSKNGVSQP